MAQVIAYIDGFNLYHGTKELMEKSHNSSSWKWIDLESLSSKLVAPGDIKVVKYYTARISAPQNDPSMGQRQQAYLRALQTNKKVHIYHGQFYRQMRRVPLAQTPNRFQYRILKILRLKFRRHPDGNVSIPIWRVEEKATDVNLGVHLVADAFRNEFDIALVISNDSDLREPIRLVAKELNKHVIVATPRGHQRVATSLQENASEVRRIRATSIIESQLPEFLADEHGEIHRPPSW